jgi:serine protease Do
MRTAGAISARPRRRGRLRIGIPEVFYNLPGSPFFRRQDACMANSRVGLRMLAWGAALGALIWANFGGQFISTVAYAVEKGKIKAASEELAELDAQLASIQTVSRAFHLVAQMTQPGVVQLIVDGGTETLAHIVEEYQRLHGPFEDLNDEERKIIEKFNRTRDPADLRGLTNQTDPDRNTRWRTLQQMSRGTGSGLIFDPAGYILTNNHVVRGRSNIRVLLHDDRELEGRLVAMDPKTDLAVVKVEAEGLHALPFGDSDKVEVGDWVVAIGAPFGLTQTVTHGIVSAVGRARIPGISIDYQNFIQTDAAVNPGNSGGPLLNLRGQVIGVNTAIATETQGVNAGVAFVIPSRTARRVALELRDKGEVARGWVGIRLDNVSPLNAELLGLKDRGGVLVTAVYAESPGDRGGLEVDDVVLSVDGTKLRNLDQFRGVIAEQSPGTAVKLTVWRDGETRDLVIHLDQQPPRVQDYARSRPARAGRELLKLDMTVRTSRPEEGAAYHDAKLTGVFILSARKLEAARSFRLLTAIDDTPVRTFQEALAATEKLAPGTVVQLRLMNAVGDELRVPFEVVRPLD